jgi:hypothetical protein
MRQVIPGVTFALVAMIAGPGHDAVALGVVVGANSPLLTQKQRAALSEIIDGGAATVSPSRKIVITAKSIDCQAGDVDIADFACTLVFGGQVSHLAGRRAQALFATLVQAGAGQNGEAGRVHRSVDTLQCTLDPRQIAQKSGGGADCTFNTNGG